MNLDDQIYCLQRTKLTPNLSALLRQADIAFIQDNENRAEELVNQLNRNVWTSEFRFTQTSDPISVSEIVPQLYW